MAGNVLHQAEAFLLELAGRANFPETRGALLRAARALFSDPLGGQNEIDDSAALAAIAGMIARGVSRRVAISIAVRRMGGGDSKRRRLARKLNISGQRIAVQDKS